MRPSLFFIISIDKFLEPVRPPLYFVWYIPIGPRCWHTARTHTYTLIASNTSRYQAQCTPLTSPTFTFLTSPLPAYFYFPDRMTDMRTFPALHLLLDPTIIYYSILAPPLLSYLLLAPIQSLSLLALLLALSPVPYYPSTCNTSLYRVLDKSLLMSFVTEPLLVTKNRMESEWSHESPGFVCVAVDAVVEPLQYTSTPSPPLSRRSSEARDECDTDSAQADSGFKCTHAALYCMRTIKHNFTQKIPRENIPSGTPSKSAMSKDGVSSALLGDYSARVERSLAAGSGGKPARVGTAMQSDEDATGKAVTQ